MSDIEEESYDDLVDEEQLSEDSPDKKQAGVTASASKKDSEQN